MITIFIYPSWLLSAILFFIIISGFVIARVPLKLSSRRVRFIILFSLMLMLIQVLITVNGEILFFIVPQFGEVGPAFPVTNFGLERGLVFALRFLLIIFSSMLFISVTDPTLLAHSLTRLRIPYRYAFALVIALRFLPIFDTETDIVRMSQKSRGISIEVGSPSKLMRTLRFTFFPLLVSALSRVDTLANSMDGRGFGYKDTRTYLRESKWHGIDTVVLLISICFLLFCIMLVLGLLPEISAII
jgi:energy-coupling factor transport system permease protein